MVFLNPETGMKEWNDGFVQMLAPQQNVNPFSAQSLPQEIDVPVTFADFAGGVGHDHPHGGSDLDLDVYNYSQGIDASWPDVLYLSPERRSMTGISTAPVKFYVSSLGTFCLNGQYIHEWDVSAQEWTQRDAAGAALAYTDIIEMDAVLYAALGNDGYKYSTDGITWTTFTDTSEDVFYFGVRSRVAASLLFKIDGKMSIKETTDGRNGGVAWTAADEIGNSGQTVTSMVMVDDLFYVFKSDHFYRYTGTETADLLVSNYVTTNNGARAFVGEDSNIYAPWGGRLLQYNPLGDTAYGYIYPQASQAGNPETNGTITALAGNSTNLYMAIKNGAGNSYIMKRAGNAWHTWAYLGANDCNSLAVIGEGNIRSLSPVLLAGYGSAAVMFVLPRVGYSPSTDSEYTFDTGTGTIVGPKVAVNAHAFDKYLNRGMVLAENCTPSRPVVLRYEIDGGSATTLVTATEEGRTESQLTTQIPFAHIRYNMTMLTADKTSSPRVVAMSFHSTPKPPRKRMWEPVVLVGESLTLRDGTVDETQSEAFIRTRLMLAPNSQCSWQDRDGSTYIVNVLNVRRTGVKRLGAGGEPNDISLYQLQIVEIAQITDTSLTALVWDEGAWDSGKVWG